MNTTETTPTAQEIYRDLKEYISTFDIIPSDWEGFIGDYLYEENGIEDDDLNDKLTKELMDMFGVESNATETFTPEERVIIRDVAKYYADNYYPAEEADEEEMAEYKKQMDALWSALQKL